MYEFFLPLSIKHSETMLLIYKIEDKEIWNEALKSGKYNGAPIDLSDGFIHFSTAEQARETAAKHFAGRNNLIIAAFDTTTLEPFLRWEISRGEALFPHYYGKLDMKTVVQTFDLPVGANGKHIFDEKIC
jgi:uncharacterized protein (DUF952 family)